MITNFRSACVALSLAAALGVMAQSWCPAGASWVYDTGNPWFGSEMRLDYAGDTLVDGYPAQRIERFSRLLLQGTLTEAEQPPGFTRTDGDVVWEWNGMEWDTLYWFSAVPGDHWQPFWPFAEDCPDHAWHVSDTATVIIDGVPLRRLWAELQESGVGVGNWTMITERIGGGGGIIFPGLPPCGAIYECYCSFVCYRDDQVNSNGDCEMTVAVRDRASTAAYLEVNPNPATTAVVFSTRKGTVIGPIEIHDPLGRHVRQYHPMTTIAQVDISALSKGWYFYRACDVQGRLISTGRILKE